MIQIEKQEILDLYPAVVLDLDDTEKDSNENTACDRFIELSKKEAARKLRRWVGSFAFDDALLETPEDEQRAQEIAFSFKQLVHAACLHRVMHVKQSGAIVETQSPGGSKVKFSDWSDESFRKEIAHFTHDAFMAVLEYS